MTLLYEMGEKPNKFTAEIGEECYNIVDKKTYVVDKFGDVHLVSETLVDETVELTLLDGWVNHGDIGNIVTAIRKGNVVTISGRIKDGTTTNGTVIAILPVGFRPAINISTVGKSGALKEYHEVYIEPNGRITFWDNVGSSPYIFATFVVD